MRTWSAAASSRPRRGALVPVHRDARPARPRPSIPRDRAAESPLLVLAVAQVAERRRPGAPRARRRGGPRRCRPRGRARHRAGSRDVPGPLGVVVVRVHVRDRARVARSSARHRHRARPRRGARVRRARRGARPTSPGAGTTSSSSSTTRSPVRALDRRPGGPRPDPGPGRRPPRPVGRRREPHRPTIASTAAPVAVGDHHDLGRRRIRERAAPRRRRAGPARSSAPRPTRTRSASGAPCHREMLRPTAVGRRSTRRATLTGRGPGPARPGSERTLA